MLPLRESFFCSTVPISTGFFLGCASSFGTELRNPLQHVSISHFFHRNDVKCWKWNLRFMPVLCFFGAFVLAVGLQIPACNAVYLVSRFKKKKGFEININIKIIFLVSNVISWKSFTICNFSLLPTFFLQIYAMLYDPNSCDKEDLCMSELFSLTWVVLGIWKPLSKQYTCEDSHGITNTNQLMKTHLFPIQITRVWQCVSPLFLMIVYCLALFREEKITCLKAFIVWRQIDSDLEIFFHIFLPLFWKFSVKCHLPEEIVIGICFSWNKMTC